MLSKNPILYAQSWEDHKVIEDGLEIKKGYKIVCILASGDNLLNLLRFEPAKVYCFDVNPAQIYEMNLKISAIKHLNYPEFITLLGYTGNKSERIQIYNTIQDELDQDTNDFWKNHRDMVTKGLAYQGWIEKYFSFLRKILKFFLDKDYYRYINSTSEVERKGIYEERINRQFIKFIFKVILKNKVGTKIFYKEIAVKTLPPKFDYSSLFWKKLYHSFVEIGCFNNPYLYWFFTGTLPENREVWQPYLRMETYKKIKNNLEKIVIIKDTLNNGLKIIESDSIDSIYISDILDWMTEDEMEKNLSELIRIAKNHARIISFVLNLDRGLPSKFQKYFKSDENKNIELFHQERTGFYTKINLYEVIK